MDDWINELERITRLRAKGALTEKEFQEAKTKIMLDSSRGIYHSPAENSRLKGVSLSNKNSGIPHNSHKYLNQTWGHFLNSSNFDKLISSNHAYYRRKFKRIIEKTDIEGKPISDSRELLNVLSFNLAGFLFGNIWAAFRGIAGWQWLIAVSSFLVTLEPLLPPPASISISIVFFLITGFYGNALYLKASAKKWVDGSPATGVNGSGPSLARVGILILVAVIALLISDQFGSNEIDESSNYSIDFD